MLMSIIISNKCLCLGAGLIVPSGIQGQSPGGGARGQSPLDADNFFFLLIYEIENQVSIRLKHEEISTRPKCS